MAPGKRFQPGLNVLYRVFDGNQNQLASPERPVSSLAFTLPFYDNFGDNYRVIVFADKYHQAGYVPVKLSPQAPVSLDLMLIPDEPGLNFSAAQWDRVKTAFPIVPSTVYDATT